MIVEDIAYNGFVKDDEVYKCTLYFVDDTIKYIYANSRFQLNKYLRRQYPIQSKIFKKKIEIVKRDSIKQ